MPRPLAVTTVALSAGAFLLVPQSAAAAPPCVAQLAGNARGDMPSVVSDWQDDFLGLDQPAGWYAVHIAQSRSDCPPLP